jgi:RHS repeat-associated protein
VIRTTNSTKPNLEFTYDASGNRIAKKVIQPNGDYKTTFYVRDASGNVMAVYKTSGTTNLTLEEQHIYGSSRLGIFKKDKNRSSNRRVLGERRYELTDHLGNVRVVMSDYKRTTVIVLSATDYYLFGMVARTYTSPEEYRYGFNGKEKDNENFEGAYDFGARILDVRLGRWLAVDPLWKKYPMDNTYMQSGNCPISMTDLDGNEKIIITGSENKKWNLGFVLPSLKMIKDYHDNNTSEPVTMLLFKAGYTEAQITRIKNYALKKGATVIVVNSADDVVNYLNTKSVDGKTNTRSQDPVRVVNIFAHGKPGYIAFGYGQGGDIEKQSLVSDKNLK